MALAGLVSLTEQFLNQTAAATQAAQTPQTPVSVAATSSPVPEDQFVPSTQNDSAAVNAEAAGLFTVAQFSLFTAAADSLLAQTAPAQGNAQARLLRRQVPRPQQPRRRPAQRTRQRRKSLLWRRKPPHRRA